ncbi:MAG: AsnC family transcriptional regulator [Hyphomicrobiales bacterium]|nr:MAG: AsnC family transcriptional regulator [Hyphomicrobiales bacterium]
MKLDAIDIKILEAVQEDGRIPKTRLAEMVNLSASPTWERLKRLEQAGIISGYRAEINLGGLTSATTVMVEVALKYHHSSGFQRFEAAVSETPEITECFATGGGIDYLMKVVCRDVDSYQRLMDRLLAADLGIDRYYSYIVTKPVKAGAAMPLRQLIGDGTC